LPRSRRFDAATCSARSDVVAPGERCTDLT
jgi:hypothetical protein